MHSFAALPVADGSGPTRCDRKSGSASQESNSRQSVEAQKKKDIYIYIFI